MSENPSVVVLIFLALCLFGGFAVTVTAIIAIIATIANALKKWWHSK